MIRWATFFIIAAVFSAILGYSELIGSASIFAKSSFFIFIFLYVASLLRTGLCRF